MEDLLDPTVWTGSDVRVDLDVTAVASDAARVSGGASLATYAHDSSGVACGSLSIAAGAQGTDVRPAPECIESRLKTGCFP